MKRHLSSRFPVYLKFLVTFSLLSTLLATAPAALADMTNGPGASAGPGPGTSTASCCTISYSGNGNTGGTAPSPLTASGQITLAGNTGNLVKTGFDFDGWNDRADGTGTIYPIGFTGTIYANVLFYAYWIPTTYKITYHGNGNTGGSVPSPTLGNGSVTFATNSGGLVKGGYTFSGWNNQANGLGFTFAPNSIMGLNADMDVYAVWTPVTYSITYSGNNNTAGSIPPPTVGYGSVYLANNTGGLTRTGFTFAGWSTQVGGSYTLFPEHAPWNLNTNINLFAVWIPITFTITYLGNGNTGGTAPSPTIGLGTVSLAGNTGSLVKAGSTFGGWNVLASGLGTNRAVLSSYNLQTNTTFYAKWTPNIYRVTYSGNGNVGGSVPPQFMGSGTTNLAFNSGTLVKTNFVFGGWNSQANGLGTTYGVNSVYTLVANVTLFAKWNPKPHTVTYVGNGNTSGSAPSATSGAGSTTLAGNTGTLAKTGATFGGWNTQANGSGTTYAAGATYNITADVTLFAKWVVAPPKLTYVGNGNTGGTAPGSVTTTAVFTLAQNTGGLVKTGHTFGGWNTQANGLGTTYPVGMIFNITADLTLYAKWN